MWKHNHTTIVIAADTHVYIKGKHTEHTWYEDTQGNRQKINTNIIASTKICIKYNMLVRISNQQQNKIATTKTCCYIVCEFVNTCAMVYHTHKQHKTSFFVVPSNQHTLAWVSCENVWEGNNIFTVCREEKRQNNCNRVPGIKMLLLLLFGMCSLSCVPIYWIYFEEFRLLNASPFAVFL